MLPKRNGRQWPFDFHPRLQAAERSVLVDGIPVNDMESGAVFWNNWFGLICNPNHASPARPRCLQAALPAIGGTVNIVTSGIEFAQDVGQARGW